MQSKMDKWYVSAQYGYVEATYKSEFQTAGGENVVSGNKIPGIPTHTLKLRTAYAFDADLLLGANVIATGSQWAHGNETNADSSGEVAGYALVNLDAHYKFNKDTQLSINVSNLFNQQYATYGLAGMTSIYTLTTQQFLTPAPPRAIWVGLTYSFGGQHRK